ncbi:hypothetical protein KAK07_24715 [Ideonella sp. 4Y16]|uniref:Uncharacterized protein n=1 Tax=Ideonella alba TaxID=2824118 RepID=A0A940YPM6_9BURK|nr:hypothetical protein [Ideonella alba]MBQ0933554.1 hypothetical protein [Ideonella alba]MBQ0946557.1 hypothetical protein [Ideonella alba]
MTRLGILRRVYAGEYFTDSFDIARLAQRVKESREFIWFWGRSAIVEAWCNGIPDTPSSCDMGTVSVIDSSEEFGPGMGEICRSGSMSAVHLKPYAVKRIIDFLSKKIPALHEAFHTLLLVPRVRAAGDGIRGGKSVNTIHRKYIRSRFWGFAPWYVMQGGFLECLEYREVNRDRDDLLRGLLAFPTIHLLDADDRRFVESLFMLNLPQHAKALGFEVPLPSVGTEARFELVCQAGEAIRQYNHRAFSVASRLDGSTGFTLDQLEASIAETSCTVVHLDISRPDSLEAQRALIERGYRLTCVRPPRAFIGEASTPSGGMPCYGSWAKPNLRWQIAAPHYALRDTTQEYEQEVVLHLRRMLDNWMRAS